MHASLCGRALQCGCCWVVSRNHQRRRAELGFTSVATAAASACGGKTSRPIHRMIAWGQEEGEWGVGGSGCGAHLDRGNLRYPRKHARIVRRAGHAVVLAAAVGYTVAWALAFDLPRSYRS